MKESILEHKKLIGGIRNGDILIHCTTIYSLQKQWRNSWGHGIMRFLIEHFIAHWILFTKKLLLQAVSRIPSSWEMVQRSILFRFSQGYKSDFRSISQANPSILAGSPVDSEEETRPWCCVRIEKALLKDRKMFGNKWVLLSYETYIDYHFWDLLGQSPPWTRPLCIDASWC